MSLPWVLCRCGLQAADLVASRLTTSLARGMSNCWCHREVRDIDPHRNWLHLVRKGFLPTDPSQAHRENIQEQIHVQFLASAVAEVKIRGLHGAHLVCESLEALC